MLSIKRSDEELLTVEQAARLLAVSPDRLASWRFRGVGPAFIRIESAVRYRRDDLESYLRVRRVRPSRGLALSEVKA